MSSLVADTHSVIWYLNQSPRLSTTARTALRTAIETGEPVFVSAVTIAEVTYLFEKGRLTELQIRNLISILHRQDSGFQVAPFDLAIAETLAQIPRHVVPDMPDRMIAATALHLGLPLITADSQIQRSAVPTIW